MLLNDLLDLRLGLRGDGTLGDLGEEGLLGAGEMVPELELPAGDLVDGDRVELKGKTSASRKRMGH